jgi:DNA invertase Pin-like site-specific DNA recombinase
MQGVCRKKGITILGSYIDRALSAKTDHRPEFQRMIKDGCKQLFDVVIVWKLDRFARNRYDSAHYKAILRKNGVRVVSAKENISEGSEGIILEAMLEGYAEYYSAELSEKVIRGLTENALKCKYNGGGMPIGYCIDSKQYFQIDPLTAPIVEEVFNRYAEGATIKKITDILNDRGIRTYRNLPMSINSVTRLLKNRKYIGEYRYRDVIHPEGIPAIVSPELFDRVQERMKKNKRAPARHKAEDAYLLTTKLFCGKCSAFMVGESGTSRIGKVHRYYKCVTAKRRRACTKKTVKKEWIENLVVEQTMHMLFNDAAIQYITDMVMELQTRESTDLPLLQRQLSDTERGIQNMLNAIQQGILTPSTKQRMDELEQTKSKLEVSILQEEIQKPMLTREQVLFWVSRFRDSDITDKAQRQRLIDSFVNAVYLYDDKMVLTFNYKDGSKTITFDEINGSDLGAVAAPY